MKILIIPLFSIVISLPITWLILGSEKTIFFLRKHKLAITFFILASVLLIPIILSMLFGVAIGVERVLAIFVESLGVSVLLALFVTLIEYFVVMRTVKRINSRSREIVDKYIKQIDDDYRVQTLLRVFRNKIEDDALSNARKIGSGNLGIYCPGSEETRFENLDQTINSMAASQVSTRRREVMHG